MTAGDERGPFLLSARQAMRYAIELASNPTPAAIDLDRARVWVTIAHELRIGEIPTRPFPRPLDAGNEGPPEAVVPRAHFGDESLLPVCEEIGPNDPEGALVVYELRDVTCHACLRVVKERELAEQIAREDTPVARHAEYEATLANNYAGETASARVDRIIDQRPEDTAVLRHGPAGAAPLSKCGNCGHHVEIDLTNIPAIWRHVMTRQAVCPVSNPDQTHSFATPLVDARG
jgi:hypothetical protein